MFNFKKEYRVSLDEEELVTPEETLMDSGSRYADMERPMTDFVFRFTFGSFFVALAFIWATSFKIGILDSANLSELAIRNKSVNFAMPPPRGIIFDKFNKPLVKNVPSFDLLVVSRDLKSGSVDSDIEKVAKALGVPFDSFRDEIMENAKNNAMFFVASNLGKEEALAIKYYELPGFYVVSNIKREYIDGNKFSQIVGYVGKVNKEDLADDYYFPTDTIGRLGLEASYENLLRGKHRNIFFEKDASGNSTREPIIGNSLISNIDLSLQKKLYDEVFEILRESGLSRAAAVIQNPQNGAVMAMVSFPSFDSNIFNSKLSNDDFKKLFENRSKPLFNRIISGLYNPGSTIKPFIGMAALEEKIVTPQDTIRDCVSISVPNPADQGNPYVFKNWRVELGLFNLKKAIANSCNVYFFTVAGGHDKVKGLGAEKIVNYLKSAFTDSSLGIDMPGEDHGFVPTPDWKLQERGENWYLGDTYNISIGQGDLLVTPLWLNGYISAIANGGTFYKPRVADKILDDNKNILDRFFSEELGRLPFKQEVIDEVRNDMKETVVSGTAQLLKDLPVEVGAKTGTAEVAKGKSINSLFTAFAPFNNPELSITVLVEGSASNQGFAIRIAHNVLKWYFERQNGVAEQGISTTASASTSN